VCAETEGGRGGQGTFVIATTFRARWTSEAALIPGRAGVVLPLYVVYCEETG
jgi:hypothetical protein